MNKNTARFDIACIYFMYLSIFIVILYMRSNNKCLFYVAIVIKMTTKFVNV